MITARRRGVPRSFDAVCQTTDVVGDLVAVIADGRTVKKADVTELSVMPAVGVVVAKVTATRAVVQTLGLLQGVYVDLLPGHLYFVGTDGRPSLVPPAATLPEQRRFLQTVGVALDAVTMQLELTASLISLRG